MDKIGTFKLKLENILKKNMDLSWFLSYNPLKVCKENKIFAYVPLTTVEVEVSFSNYKFIFSDRRQNLSINSML